MELKNTWLHYEFSDNFVIAATTLLFLPFVLFLRLIGGTWLVSNHHYPSLLQTLLVASIIFGLWLISKLVFRKNFFYSGLEVHLIPFLAVVCLSTAFSSNVSLSAEKALGVGVYFLLALLILEIRKFGNMWEGLINSLLITALITSLISLFVIIYTFHTYQLSPIDIIQGIGYAIKTLPRMPGIKNLHITISAGYYLMIFPLAIYRWTSTKSKLTKLIIAFGFFLSACVVLLTQSRGSMIGMFMMMLCAVYLERVRIWEIIKKKPSLSLTLGVIGLVVISVLVMYIFVRRGFSLAEENILCRVQAWKISLKILMENPLFGSGMETFGQHFLEARDSEICSKLLHVTHNDFLQILVNFGLAGLGALTYFFVIFWRKAKKDWKISRKRIRYCLIALAGLVGMGIMTTMLYSPNIRFLIILYLVWMIPDGEIRESENGTWKAWALILLMGLLAGGFGWTLWKVKPYYQARNAADNMEFDKAKELLMVAVDRDPELAYYDQTLAFIEAQNYCSNNTNIEVPVALYRRSLEETSFRSDDHANLASVLASGGNYKDAITEMEIAINLDLKNYAYSCIIGSYYHEIGEEQYALEALSECIAGNRTWLDTPFWDELELGHEFNYQVIELAITKIKSQKSADQNLSIAKLYYFDGQYENAQFYLNLYGGENASDYESLLYQSLSSLKLNQLSDAVEYSKMAVDLNPRCWQCWLVLAEIAIEEENLDSAEKALNISEYLEVTPQSRVLFAKLYSRKGDNLSAIEALRLASYFELPTDLYSHSVASRWRLDTNHLKCQPAGLTYQYYYLPLEEGLSILKELSCEDLREYLAAAMALDTISYNYFKEEFDQVQCQP